MNSFPTPSPEELNRKLAFGLTKVASALKKQAWIHAGTTGLSPTQSKILTYLLRRRGQETRLNDISAELSLTPATVSVSLSTLRRKKLARKRPGNGDARLLSISLTPRGAQLAQEASTLPERLIDASQILSPLEQRQFLSSLLKVIRHLQNTKQISTSRMCLTCKYFKPNVYRSAEKPHHCGFVNAAFGDIHLRVDCPEHEPSSE